MPVTPMAESASRTSSSLNGLMIAVTSFIWVLALENVFHEGVDRVLGDRLGLGRGVERLVRVIEGDSPAGSEAVAEVLADLELVIDVRRERRARAAEALVSHVSGERPGFGDRKHAGQV